MPKALATTATITKLRLANGYYDPKEFKGKTVTTLRIHGGLKDVEFEVVGDFGNLNELVEIEITPTGMKADEVLVESQENE